MQWDDLRIVLAIGRTGSLSGAARALGTSHATVFRRINAIETQQATRFFNRHAGGYSLTDAGEAALRVAEKIDEDVLELARALQGRDLRLQGNIRLTAPEGVAHYLLAAPLADFLRTHPDIHIELLVSSQAFQLERHEADVALRVTARPPASSIGQKICDFPMAIYATSEYVTRLEDRALTDYEFVLSKDGLDWFPSSIWKKKRPRVVFTADTILAVVNAVKFGVGAAALPCFIGEREPALRRLTPPLLDQPLALWVLAHADLRRTARVRALMTHLHASLGAQTLKKSKNAGN